MGESVVADAGPLIAFGRIRKRELLPQVLGEVLVPRAVAVDRLADPSMHSNKRTFEAVNQCPWRHRCIGEDQGHRLRFSAGRRRGMSFIAGALPPKAARRLPACTRTNTFIASRKRSLLSMPGSATSNAF